GGKDSFYNLMQCVANGHSVIALGNLHPKLEDKKDELDSYMYQTVGHDVIHLYKDCLDLPLYRQEIKGKPIEQGSDYVRTEKDETEDLYELLAKAKAEHPELEAVSVGAILSNYQRIRVESVCARLGLVTLAYLWQRDQEELLHEMAQAGVNAVLIKIAAIGLKKQHLGRSIGDMFPYFCKMNQEYDLHICGEGGEYETITLDCPLFRRRIVVDESEIVIHSDDAFAQVAYLRFKKLHLEDKNEDDMDPSWTADMNLDPVWEADSIMLPIEDIVRSKQLLLENVGENKLTIERQHAFMSEDMDAQSNYFSKFSLHRGDIVCAIGGTTAHEMFSAGCKKHMSIAEETTICLKNVQGSDPMLYRYHILNIVELTLELIYSIGGPLAKLERIGLSWAEVVFMQVFVSDMADFGVVNGAYKMFFGINPPPRACVGANLPKPCRIQVSCTAIRKSASTPKPRQTLHVQGISYWAPANIVYVRSPLDFEPVTAAWDYISNKKTPAPLLAVCVPSLPKGGQVEWQAMLHQGKVYAEKTPVETGLQDGYETDDDDIYEVQKRALHPTTLSLDHEQLRSSVPATVASPDMRWKTSTRSWYLSPLLAALSVVHAPDTTAYSLSSLLSSLTISNEDSRTETETVGGPVLKDMMAMMVKAMDRVLEAHITPESGPGVEAGWNDVVSMTLYYHESIVIQPEKLLIAFEQLLSQFTNATDSSGGSSSNIAVTLIPVQAIAGGGVLALTLQAAGRMPTLPGLLQA
ncbi:ATP binding domain 4, partial [Mortierella sp. GBA30]